MMLRMPEGFKIHRRNPGGFWNLYSESQK